MDIHPDSLAAFQRQFPTESACLEFLVSWRWPNGFVCPACGAREHVRLRARPLWQCAACRRQTSITAGTALQHTKVPLRIWVYALWLLGRPDRRTSAKQFQRETGLGQYRSALHLLHKVRATLKNPERRPLEGVVEEGGWDMSGREIRGPMEGPVVFAAVAGPIAAAEVLDLRRPLSSLIAVATDAKIAWSGAGVAGFFAGLRRWLIDVHKGVTTPYFERYLHEHVYRSNRRELGWRLFGFLARRVTNAPWRPPRHYGTGSSEPHVPGSA